MDPQYIPQTNATTTGPSFVNHAITYDNKLREKTSLVVLVREAGRFMARVYRSSSTSPGQLSCDIHEWDQAGRKWEWKRKDGQKHAVAPVAPGGAHSGDIDGCPFWTMAVPSPDELGELKRLIFALKEKDRETNAPT